MNANLNNVGRVEAEKRVQLQADFQEANPIF
jgi:hypothetical protein